MPKLPTKLPHLNGALGLIGPRGMCFHRSVGLVLDVPVAKLVVGTFRGAPPEEFAADPNLSPVPFLHCWVEISGNVYSPAILERMNGRLCPFNREEYYATNQAKNIHVMPRGRLKQLDAEYGLADHLLYHVPVRKDAAFGGVILDAMEVRYTVTDKGGLVPGE